MRTTSGVESTGHPRSDWPDWTTTLAPMASPVLRPWYLWQAHRVRPAAERGERVATYNLALMLDQAGRTTEAMSWYRHAADAGDHDAANNLALLLERAGRHDEALHYYRRAADGGDPEVMYNLAVGLEEQGDDPVEARAWYQRAAAAGDQDARRALHQG
jgi:TPR repeat protein